MRPRTLRRHLGNPIWYALPQYAETIREHIHRTSEEAVRVNDYGRSEDTIDRWLDRLRAQLPF